MEIIDHPDTRNVGLQRDFVQYIHSFYERAFAKALGPGVEAFSFWKGRVALYAILQALGIHAGDEVILPGFTCVVVANAIRFAGARPIYVDTRPGTYHIDPNCVTEAITSRTRAILVQHTFGIPGFVEEILAIARPLRIAVIEDSAHALSSTLNGKKVGLFGDAAFFSSQWSKPYSTGLGGMAVTSDEHLARHLERIYWEKNTPPYMDRAKLWVQIQGYRQFFSPQLYWQAQGILRTLSNVGLFVGSSSSAELEGEMPADHTWRMGAFQQHTGQGQLNSVEQDIQHRRMLANYYDSGLCENGWEPAFRRGETVFLRYPIRVGNKEELLRKAKTARVELGSWFETPLHPTPLDKHATFEYRLGQCPNSEADACHVVNLPMHKWITVDEASRILAFFVANAVQPKAVSFNRPRQKVSVLPDVTY